MAPGSGSQVSLNSTVISSGPLVACWAADRDCFPTPPPAAFRAFQLGRAHRTCLRHSALPEVLLSKVSVLSNSKLQISPSLSSCTSIHYLYILSLKKKKKKHSCRAGPHDRDGRGR